MGILKAALEANVILLFGYGVYHVVRAPWLRDIAQAETISTVQDKLIMEEDKNQHPEIKGIIEKACFDISYQPEYKGSLLALELSLWNNRNVPTTIRGVSLTVLTNGSTLSTIAQSLTSQEVQIGITRLEYLLGKIWPNNPLRYNIHENGWLLFYADRLILSNPSKVTKGVTLRLEFVDASGTKHLLEQTCDLQRCNVQAIQRPLNTVNQYRISS